MRAILGSWDAVGSVVAGLVLLAFLTTTDRALLDAQPYLIAGIALGGVIGTAWLVGSRWLTDHLGKDEYGEIIRMFDTDSRMTQKPYLVITVSGFVLIMGSLVLLVSYRNLPRAALVMSYSVLFALAFYCALGSISLALITRRHVTRASTVRALKERAAREIRERKPPEDPT